MKQNYKEKFLNNIENTNFNKLSKENQDFFEDISIEYKFSFQELKQLIDFTIDFTMWNEKDIKQIFKDKYSNKKEAFSHIRDVWSELKKKPNDYSSFNKSSYIAGKKIISFEKRDDKENLSLGYCPVASEKTRCCNLLTLDAVESCGFDCSYCSIQSFYNENKVTFDASFAKKLKNLELNADEIYHIGTGQSSDSLMWGNKEGILDALFNFAKRNKNVILEFKTKSNNISYFLENEVPSNIICTWSLNTPIIIENEEHLSATLEKRINSARALADKGVLVGFHFHPMVQYENYLDDYKKIFDTLTQTFTPKEVVLVSLGTLTFIKPVVQKIRNRDFKSKILQMPFVNANKKQSYPLETKREMFKFAYDSLKPWHKKVYFYLCMEEPSLWNDVFGYEYASNKEMEESMKSAYMEKIKENAYPLTQNIL